MDAKNIQKKQKRMISPIIFLLTFTDIFTWGGVYIFMSLISLYLAQKFDVDVVRMAGIGVGLRFLFRALFQLPMGILADRMKKDNDEIIFIGFGMSVMAAAIISTTFINSPAQYYILEAFMGLGAAFNVVNWRKLFARNLEKGKEGISYAVYDTAISLCIALFTMSAGVVANSGEDQFELVIFWTGIVMLASNIWVILIYLFEKSEHKI